MDLEHITNTDNCKCESYSKCIKGFILSLNITFKRTENQNLKLFADLAVKAMSLILLTVQSS